MKKLLPFLACFAIGFPQLAYATMALQGNNYLCKNASYMQLWELSERTSSLTRHQLLLDETCWKPMKGIHVEVLDRIGKYSRVQYVGNGIVAYAYTSDLKEVRPEKPKVAPTKTSIIRSADKLKRVDSLTSDKEVMLMKGKPTVNFFFSAGGDSEVEIIILKESLKTGLNLKIDNQKNGVIQVSVKHKKLKGGLRAPDYVTFEVLERNDDKKYMDVRVGGYWNQFDRDRNIDLEIKPTTIRISGPQFLEAVRPHTATELQNPFKDFSGKTT